jgi:hypothetical protein
VCSASGARAAFSYGAVHWFPAQLAQWCTAHQVTGDAITNSLIFMAVAMIATRTLGLATRAATHLDREPRFARFAGGSLAGSLAREGTLPGAAMAFKHTGDDRLNIWCGAASYKRDSQWRPG